MKPLVIYHGNCQDGFTAAWACWLLHPDWEYYSAKHGDPPPANAVDRTVYMLDFSYKRPVIIDLLHLGNVITIIDHHQSAEKELAELEDPNLTVIFDMTQSGAMLAWKYFHGSSGYSIADRPELVDFVQDRDLWRFNYPETKHITLALFSEEYNFTTWTLYAEHLSDSTKRGAIIEAGRAIERKHNKDIAELLQNKFRYTIGGHEVWCCNLPYTMASDAANTLAEGEPFGATYYYDGEGYVFSLRSKETGIDVSEIASKYGGGGHKHAAGFKIKYPIHIKKDGRLEHDAQTFVSNHIGPLD